MADALDSKSSSGNTVRVQVPPPAHMKKPTIIVVCGPTAVGKSDYAVTLAKKYNGEIISADSRQVYRGLNLGTGKITKKEMQGIPHHLLDVVSPQKNFTVTEFQDYGEKAIASILKKGKTPIICGGTGFYIDALVYTIKFPNVAPNHLLRKKFENKSTKALFAELKKIDPKRANTIDPHNKVRIIRALEIISVLGKVPSIKKKSSYTVTWIGLRTKDDEELRKRIITRVHSRIKKGMLTEALQLHKNGLTWKRMRELGLEYRFLADFHTKKITKEELLTKLPIAIYQYAKRQMTWFKRNKNITWYTI